MGLEDLVVRVMGDLVFSVVLFFLLRDVMGKMAMQVDYLREENKAYRDEIAKIGEWQRQMILNFMQGSLTVK